MNENKNFIAFESVSYDENVAKLSIVGAGMVSNPGIASSMFEAMYVNGININMISTSDIKISVLIDEKDCERAAIAVHDKFIVENVNLSK